MYSSKVLRKSYFLPMQEERADCYPQAASFCSCTRSEAALNDVDLLDATNSSLHQCYPSNRHLDNCSTSSVDKKPWHFKLPVPISHLRSHPPPLVYSNGTWTMNFMFPKPEHFMPRVMCIINIPGGAGPCDILGPTQMLQCSPFLATLMMQKNS